MTEDPPVTDGDDPFEPVVRKAQLDPEVTKLRQIAAAEAAALNAIVEPLLDRHIEAYAAAVDSLEFTHVAIADKTDIDLGADTRWTATWELTGRCISICRVLLHDLRGGFGGEAIGTLRALHEATMLLGAVAFHGDRRTARRWLEGKYIPYKEATAVVGKQNELARTRMEEAGIPDDGTDVVKLGQQIYGMMSEGAHHRRAALEENLAPRLRQYAYGGPHPSAHVRAGNVSYCGHFLEEVVIVVGSAFADILGPEYYKSGVQPILNSLRDVRERAPIEDGP
jgi:hypothetical protein